MAPPARAEAQTTAVVVSNHIVVAVMPEDHVNMASTSKRAACFERITLVLFDSGLMNFHAVGRHCEKDLGNSVSHRFRGF